MANNFKKSEISNSGKQQQAPFIKHQTFWEKYGGAPLAFIMRNPRVTPVALFILATVPLVVTTVVLVLIWLWQ
jgi:hypothetical protein